MDNPYTGLYTSEVDNFIMTRAWPKGVHFRVRAGWEPEPHLKIIFFRDNWLTLSVEDQLATTAIVKEIMAKLWADGIPTYTGKMKNRYSEDEDE